LFHRDERRLTLLRHRSKARQQELHRSKVQQLELLRSKVPELVRSKLVLVRSKLVLEHSTLPYEQHNVREAWRTNRRHSSFQQQEHSTQLVLELVHSSFA